MSKPIDKADPKHGSGVSKSPGNDEHPLRRRDDLTIRGADPKEMSPPRQMSEHLGKKTK